MLYQIYYYGALSALLLSLLTGCAKIQQSRSDANVDEKVNELLNYHQKRILELEQEKIKYHNGINLLQISNPAAPLEQRLLSVKLKQASLNNILSQLDVDYVLQGISMLEGRVSAEFEAVLLPKAISELLGMRGFTAQLVGTTFVISQRSSGQDFSLVPIQTVQRKYALKNADTRALKSTIDSMFLKRMENGGITYAIIDGENAVLLEGNLDSVIEALRIIKTIDSNPGHLMIEALVIEFGNESIVDIGNRISKAASGNFSDIALDWSSIAGNTITFTNLAGAANDLTFNAAISLLIQNDEAQIISRPYLSTASGSKARLEVVNDRYVTASNESGDGVILRPVKGGVTLEMQPFLLPDNQVRIDISVIASSFAPTTGNVSLSVSRSQVDSTLMVALGETFIIGGITFTRESSSKTGIPLLRDLPGVGVLFGSKATNSSTRQLLVYITPRLWEPALQRPLLGTRAGRASRSNTDRLENTETPP